jgi:hypothetical protein
MSHWDFRPPADDAAAPPLPRRNRDEYRPNPASGSGGRPENQGGAGIPGTASGGLPGDPRGSRTTEWYAPPDDAPDDSWDAGYLDADDPDAALYPLTYERDPFVEADPAPPAAPPRPRQPWPPAPRPDGLVAPELFFASGRNAATVAADPGGDYATEEWELPPGGPGGRDGRDQGGRRWLLPAGIAVAGLAVGASAVLLFGGHQKNVAASTRSTGTPRAAAPPSATASPAPAATGPLTLTQAQGVLAAYTATNNSANAQFDSALLGTIETGSSDAIDAALYRGQQAAKASRYPPFSAVRATYFIPGDEPATGPRWFAVQVANAFNSNPAKVTNTEYLLFTQAAPGGAWQDAIEPYLLSAGSVPRVAVGADGLATAVSAGATADVVAPGQLAAVTATSLDAANGQATVADPGNLNDVVDTKNWRASVRGGTVTDAHAAATGPDGQEFALLTSDGGALVFYTDAATVTVTPPAGSGLRLNVPGFFSSGQAVSQAVLGFQEQFAAYDPPAGQGAPRVVADYSGITGQG